MFNYYKLLLNATIYLKVNFIFMEIPKIIHQVWSGSNGPLPEVLKEISQTWIKLHPKWEYQFWDKDRMDNFVKRYYPEFFSIYNGYIYDVQRWDVIRYLLLFKIGGVYVDFDYECLKSIEDLIDGHSCCIGLDPDEHAKIFHKPYIISNALMAIEAGHPFMKAVIQYLNNQNVLAYDAIDQFNNVLNTTGPYMLTRVYQSYKFKKQLYLVPSSMTSPLTKSEVGLLINEHINPCVLDEKIKNAFAIHYFFGSWYK